MEGRLAGCAATQGEAYRCSEREEQIARSANAVVMLDFSDERDRIVVHEIQIFSLDVQSTQYIMAPTPQTSGTSSAPSPSTMPQVPSVLPGLKRGIAVGVASSVCLILIALLSFFALRRRKQRKAQRQRGLTPDIKELPAWAQAAPTPALPEKNWIPIPPSPIEADTQVLYELEASPPPVPELPTKIHVPGPQELDAEYAGEDAHDLKRTSLGTRESVESYGASAPRYSDVPTLCISPPEMSRLSTTSLLAISPMAVSPLEEAYLAQSPRSPRSPQLSPQHWI